MKLMLKSIVIALSLVAVSGPVAAQAKHYLVISTSSSALSGGGGGPSGGDGEESGLPEGDGPTGDPSVSVTLAPYHLPVARLYQPYSFSFHDLLTVTGDPSYSPGNVSWSVTPALPAGFTLVNGELSGSSNDYSRTTHTVTATYGGQSYSETYTLAAQTGYLHANGVTVKCEGMPDGTLFTLPQTGDIEWRAVHSMPQAVMHAEVACTSNITDMSFAYLSPDFNADISHWDTSNVTNMASMFYGATSFNQPIGHWDTSQVANMRGMFSGAENFNQPINDWDVSGVFEMESMFEGASNFNQSLNNWDISNVWNLGNMFAEAHAFNGDISNWDLSSVVSTAAMFYNARAFNQPLDSWNTFWVNDMSMMFSGAESFNRPLNNWDVSNVINMSMMFYGASAFNQDLNNWDTSLVNNMEMMFAEAPAFNGDVSSWNTVNVTRMSHMFNNASSFDGAICNWDVSSALANIDNATNAPRFFLDGSALQTTHAPQFSGSGWGTFCQ